MGSLLDYVTGRAIRIGLISARGLHEGGGKTEEEMKRYKLQVPSVNFSWLGVHQSAGDQDVVLDAMDGLRKPSQEGGPSFDILAKEIMIVSDRDDLLRSARDSGCFTCRVRPPNGRRGDISTNWTVEKVEEVEGVLDEILGISYNNVRNTKGRFVDHGGV